MSFPDRHEIARSIFGAWRIARLDPRALAWFDLSADGFYRSFAAMAVVAPFYLMTMLVVLVSGGLGLDGAGDAMAADADGPDAATYLAVQAVFYVVRWIGYALLLVPITMLIGAADRYATYVVVWNWASVLQIGVMLPATTIVAAELVPEVLSQAILLAAVLTVLAYSYLVVRAGLGCAPVQALALVVLEVVWNAVLDGVADGIAELLSGPGGSG